MIAALFVLSAIGTATRGGQPPTTERPGGDPDAEEPDDFLYSVVTSANDGVLRNIDTAQLALLAVLAADMTIVVFGIDKGRELAWPWSARAYASFAGSSLASIVGYFIGLFRDPEPVDPARFMLDFTDDPEAARSKATLGTVQGFYRNAGDRTAKNIAVVIALGLLIAGTVFIAVARSLAVVDAGTVLLAVAGSLAGVV